MICWSTVYIITAFVSLILITCYPFVLMPWGEFFIKNEGWFYEYYMQTSKLDSLNLGDHFFPFPPLGLAAIIWMWYWFYGNTLKGINQENRSFCEFSKAYYRVPHYNTLPIYNPNNSSPLTIDYIFKWLSLLHAVYWNTLYSLHKSS